MVLRRIIESLQTRNFSIFAVELVIVVVGVFIGIQVSNWNDARIDRNRAHAYLERIQDDLEADIVNYQDRLRFWQQVSDYGTTGLDYANTGDSGGLTDWNLLLAYFQASQLAEFLTTRSTYEELKSGGELGLISNLEIRNLLSRYYTNADNPVLSERPAYREHVRALIPLRIQNYIWEQCYSSGGGTQHLVDCASPIGAQEAAAVVEAIRRNEQLIFELRYWMSTMRVARLMGEDRVISAEQLRNRVHEILDDAPAPEKPPTR